MERAFDFIGENTRDHEAVDRIIEYLSWEKGAKLSRPASPPRRINTSSNVRVR